MDANREADELASRCVALVVFHEHARKTRPDRRAIDAEFRDVVEEARKGRITPAIIAAKVMDGLLDRYEAEMAKRLHRDYLAGLSAGVQVGLIPA